MIHLLLPLLPPTTNHAYTTTIKRDSRGNRAVIRTMSEEGKRFKQDAKLALLPSFMCTKLDKDKQYGLFLILYFPSLSCKGWPKKAKRRYKRLDATNRVKLVEDCVAEVSGLDDSHFFTVITSKREGPSRTSIYLWALEEEEPPPLCAP